MFDEWKKSKAEKEKNIMNRASTPKCPVLHSSSRKKAVSSPPSPSSPTKERARKARSVIGKNSVASPSSTRVNALTTTSIATDPPCSPSGTASPWLSMISKMQEDVAKSLSDSVNTAATTTSTACSSLSKSQNIESCFDVTDEEVASSRNSYQLKSKNPPIESKTPVRKRTDTSSPEPSVSSLPRSSPLVTPKTPIKTPKSMSVLNENHSDGSTSPRTKKQQQSNHELQLSTTAKRLAYSRDLRLKKQHPIDNTETTNIGKQHFINPTYTSGQCTDEKGSKMFTSSTLSSKPFTLGTCTPPSRKHKSMTKQSSHHHRRRNSNASNVSSCNSTNEHVVPSSSALVVMPEKSMVPVRTPTRKKPLPHYMSHTKSSESSKSEKSTSSSRRKHHASNSTALTLTPSKALTVTPSKSLVRYGNKDQSLMNSSLSPISHYDGGTKGRRVISTPPSSLPRSSSSTRREPKSPSRETPFWRHHKQLTQETSNSRNSKNIMRKAVAATTQMNSTRSSSQTNSDVALEKRGYVLGQKRSTQDDSFSSNGANDSTASLNSSSTFKRMAYDKSRRQSQQAELKKSTPAAGLAVFAPTNANKPFEIGSITGNDTTCTFSPSRKTKRSRKKDTTNASPKTKMVNTIFPTQHGKEAIKSPTLLSTFNFADKTASKRDDGYEIDMSLEQNENDSSVISLVSTPTPRKTHSDALHAKTNNNCSKYAPNGTKVSTPTPTGILHKPITPENSTSSNSATLSSSKAKNRTRHVSFPSQVVSSTVTLPSPTPAEREEAKRRNALRRARITAATVAAHAKKSSTAVVSKAKQRGKLLPSTSNSGTSSLKKHPPPPTLVSPNTRPHRQQKCSVTVISSITTAATSKSATNKTTTKPFSVGVNRSFNSNKSQARHKSSSMKSNGSSKQQREQSSKDETPIKTSSSDNAASIIEEFSHKVSPPLEEMFQQTNFFADNDKEMQKPEDRHEQQHGIAGTYQESHIDSKKLSHGKWQQFLLDQTMQVATTTAAAAAAAAAVTPSPTAINTSRALTMTPIRALTPFAPKNSHSVHHGEESVLGHVEHLITSSLESLPKNLSPGVQNGLNRSVKLLQDMQLQSSISTNSSSIVPITPTTTKTLSSSIETPCSSFYKNPTSDIQFYADEMSEVRRLQMENCNLKLALAKKKHINFMNNNSSSDYALIPATPNFDYTKGTPSSLHMYGGSAPSTKLFKSPSSSYTPSVELSFSESMSPEEGKTGIKFNSSSSGTSSANRYSDESKWEPYSSSNTSNLFSLDYRKTSQDISLTAKGKSAIPSSLSESLSSSSPPRSFRKSSVSPIATTPHPNTGAISRIRTKTSSSQSEPKNSSELVLSNMACKRTATSNIGSSTISSLSSLMDRMLSLEEEIQSVEKTMSPKSSSSRGFTSSHKTKSQ